MGGSYYADEEGELWIELYKEGNVPLGKIKVTNLDPGEEVYKDLIRGDVR